ncbi:MAG: cobalamin-binding protein [Anaerolineaceae bacterium]|nr:cobalamin-binding protein [Anaerolineaceae bacterium]
MNKQKITPVYLILLFALLLGACNVQSAAPAADTNIVLIDGLGREVRLAEPAMRIVSMAPSNTEIIYAVGAGDALVGRDEFSNYPEEALDIASIGGGMEDFNLETITALDPDLVLAAEINPPEIVDALEKLDIPVYYLSNPHDFAGLYENLITVGTLSGHEADAIALSDSLQVRVENILNAVAKQETIPTVFFELDASESAKPWTSGGGTFVDYLISMAGAQNIAADVTDEWVQYSQENLIIQNPDIIILADAKWGITTDMVKERPGWETLSAVANDAIYPIDDDLTSRPGPRLADGLETLVKICHPDIELND